MFAFLLQRAKEFSKTQIIYINCLHADKIKTNTVYFLFHTQLHSMYIFHIKNDPRFSTLLGTEFQECSWRRYEDWWGLGRSSDGDRRLRSAPIGCGPDLCNPPGGKNRFYLSLEEPSFNPHIRKQYCGKTEAIFTFCPLGPVQQLASCQGRYSLSASQICWVSGSSKLQKAQELHSTSRPSSQRRAAYCRGPQVLQRAHTVLLLAPHAVAT